MTKPKQLIFLLLLFIVVGIAAVSSNLLINGSTPIASNPDDFNVYFSDVLVNGTQDLSLVTSETSLVFTGEFSAVGDKKEITYDVTNASKNYDADIDITCTQSTEYLTITNSFDTSTNLAATSTRTGVLSITLSKSYTGEDLTQDISCTISASAVERTSQGSGSVAGTIDPLYIGREISIGEEKFNVISIDGDNVTMLARYNLEWDTFKQTTKQSGAVFSDIAGWEYQPGPKEIDIQVLSEEIKTLLNGYVSYLQLELGESEVSVNLITLAELKLLGCTIKDDYSDTSGMTCENSSYESWLINAQNWWTRSAESTDSDDVWIVMASGGLSVTNCGLDFGVRPTITITKETASALIKYKIYDIGEEISIGDETFNVISQTPSTVKMLAQYNISDGGLYEQTDNQIWTVFSETDGWEYTPGPKEIDVQTWGGDVKAILNNYVSYLNTQYGVTVTGDLITLSELGELGCIVPTDYAYGSGGWTCTGSEHSNWLINGQHWWTRSADSTYSIHVWYVYADGNLSDYHCNYGSGVRPVITISKEYLE